MLADDGWFTLVGLEWLEPGVNTMGSDSTLDIVLPSPAPDSIGSIYWQGDELFASLYAEAGVQINDTIATRIDSIANNYPVLTYQGLKWFPIKRGDKWGIRIRDFQSDARKNFHGLEYFTANLDLVLEAEFVANEPGKAIPIDNVVGITYDYPNPGRLDFYVGGEKHSLELVDDGTEGKYFLIFGDQTSGKETYSGGRYMYVEHPRPDNKVVLDFNKAYNPPCVFTQYATCPLPPQQNILDIHILAGEKDYKK